MKFIVDEMVCSTNLSFGMYPGLLMVPWRRFIIRRRSPESAFPASVGGGEWTGTMCLTEPQCGTGFALIRTRAEPQADGTLCHYRDQNLDYRRA